MGSEMEEMGAANSEYLAFGKSTGKNVSQWTRMKNKEEARET